jgi:nucleoside phosphorylase
MTDTNNIVLFVYDSKENYSKSEKFLGVSNFKKVICIQDDAEFHSAFEQLDPSEFVFMAVHVFYTDKISGIKSFAASRVPKRYSGLNFAYISEGDSKEIQKMMIDARLNSARIYKYHELQSELEDGQLKAVSKSQVLRQGSTTSSSQKNQFVPEYGVQYAVITALEEDEMEQVLPWVEKQGVIADGKHLIEYGHVKGKPDKRIAYASQAATGMIDAAILASIMIQTFHPKILIMVGVLGGKPEEVNIGDIVVATKVFTIDKGKIKSIGFQPELEVSNNDSSYITQLRREKKKLLSFISESDPTRKKLVNIHFGAIACVRQVIDLEGYFEENISPIDRKAVALEMESYGVARACELVNNGKTSVLIVKSAMDNTVDKVDDAKTYAAWTSAKVIEYALTQDLF